MSYGDFPVCKQHLKCWLCVFLFSRQNGAERKQRPIFTFFLRPFSNHSARHRLPLLGYPLSGKSTRQLSNYKRKNYWLCKLSIYFSNAHFHMLFGFPPASGRESVPLVCPHCRPCLPAHNTALEFQHIQRPVHVRDLRFRVGFPFLKHGFSLRVGGRSFYTPIHS